jgi:hypothetical protein
VVSKAVTRQQSQRTYAPGSKLDDGSATLESELHDIFAAGDFSDERAFAIAEKQLDAEKAKKAQQAHEARMEVRRLERKEKQQRQKKKREETMRKIFEADKEMQARLKHAKKALAERGKASYMNLELKEILKVAVKYALYFGQPDIHGKIPYEISLRKYFGSPALRVLPGAFSSDPQAEDIDLDDMTSTYIHPAVYSYFLNRDTDARYIYEMVDEETRKRNHAAKQGFTIRQSVRQSHSSLRSSSMMRDSMERASAARASNSTSRISIADKSYTGMV